MKITKLELEGACILEPQYFEDDRGYYTENYSARTMQELGLESDYLQDSHSFSLKKNTIRGIHFQNNPKAQVKIVRCTNGKILDCIIDLRKSSKTYKQHILVELSKENRKQVYIPKGFGHAFLTLTDNCEVLYKSDICYEPELYRSIKWNDPVLGINWGVTHDIIISQKDEVAPLLKDSDVNFD